MKTDMPFENVLYDALHDLLSLGHDRVVLSNGDSSTLPPQYLCDAIDALRPPGALSRFLEYSLGHRRSGVPDARTRRKSGSTFAVVVTRGTCRALEMISKWRRGACDPRLFSSDNRTRTVNEYRRALVA
jgi:hypothetical protein